MNIEEMWDKARKRTEILRMRMLDLSTFDATRMSYIFLAESSVNPGDTVVRKGSVLIERPAIAMPGFSPQFSGFELEKDLHINEDTLVTFLLVRGIHFPSLKYRHQVSNLDILEGSLAQAVKRWETTLKQREDITTGLLVGPEEAWQLSVVLLVGALVVRSADGDLRRIIDAWRKRQEGS